MVVAIFFSGHFLPEVKSHCEKEASLGFYERLSQLNHYLKFQIAEFS
jgi:hypothetical protein